VGTHDLKTANGMFDFVFQLYNFIELAEKASHTLCNPDARVDKVKNDITGMNLRSYTSALGKRSRDADDADNAPASKRKNTKSGRGPVENDILSDVVMLEALKCAGYTIPREMENFERLLPVRVSFPWKAQD
jgi:hypothetical protein